MRKKHHPTTVHGYDLTPAKLTRTGKKRLAKRYLWPLLLLGAVIDGTLWFWFHMQGECYGIFCYLD